MTCPNCGTPATEGAKRCDCGYDFASGSIERPPSLGEGQKADAGDSQALDHGVPDSKAVDPYLASCKNFAAIVRLQLLYAVVLLMGALMTRQQLGGHVELLTIEVKYLLGLMVLLFAAWLLIRRRTWIPMWSVVIVALCILSLVGRTMLVFGIGDLGLEVTGFATVFIALFAVVDVLTLWIAIVAFREWRKKRPTSISKSLG